MTIHAGGCLCGAVRYETLTEPRASDGLPLPVLPACHRIGLYGGADLPAGRPAGDAAVLRSVYDMRSAGSGKLVHVHFCQTVRHEAVSDIRTVRLRPAGSMPARSTTRTGSTVGADNSQAYLRGSGASRHDPAGRRQPVRQHALLNDGTPLEPMTLGEPTLPAGALTSTPRATAAASWIACCLGFRLRWNVATAGRLCA